MKAAALRGALSDRARHDRVHVVSALVERRRAVDQGRARPRCARSAQAENVLLVLDRDDELTWRACATLAEVHVLDADQLNTYDVLCSDDDRVHRGRRTRPWSTRIQKRTSGKEDGK